MRATPDDILGMAFFARVVEAKSFSVAARALGVSKSAISARVAKLEEKLGVRLLHRTTRRLALTADGVRLYELCARIAAQADEAAEVAAGASSIARGTVRAHAPAGFSESYLVKPIGEFLHAHPNVRVDLRLSDRPLSLGALDDVDLAIVIGAQLNDSALTVRKLGMVRIVTCASPTYLRTRGIPFRPQDLVDHDCLSSSSSSSPPEDDVLQFHTDEGAVSMTRLSKLIVDDARFLRDAALEGQGIVMLPEFLVLEDLAALRLFRVLDDFQTIELGVQALHPHGRLPPASVRAFLDHLAKTFRPQPPWASSIATTPAKPSSTSTTNKKKTSGAKTGAPAIITMTEQDVRRLTAVADLYEEIEPTNANHLREVASRAKTMPASKIPRTTVTMNSRIRVAEDRELSLIYPWDNVGRDRISVLSSFGLALLGASVGDKIPENADKKLTIRAIPYQPEAAGDHHL